MNRAIGACLILLLAWGSARGETTWSVAVLGGIAWNREWTPILRQHGVDYPFARLRPILATVEVSLGFLGGPILRSGEPSPGVQAPRRADPIAALAFQRAGLRGLCLSSSRLLDYGPTGLLETLRILDEYGIVAFGAGENDVLARMSGFLSISGQTIACLGYLHGSFLTHALPETPGTNPALPSILREDVALARGSNDLVFVFFHWAPDGETIDGRQRRFAQMAIQAGADAVFGYRPGRWQGMTLLDGRPVFYGLGDLFLETRAKRHQRLVVPVLRYRGTRLESIRLYPVQVDALPEAGERIPEVRLQPTVLTGPEAVATLRAFQDRSTLDRPIKMVANVGVIPLADTEAPAGR